MKRVIVIAAMLAAFGLGGAAAFAATADKPPSPPGQGECEHGNSQQQCKDDPSDHGKDCEQHGNQGGVNEDHCTADSTTTVPGLVSGMAHPCKASEDVGVSSHPLTRFPRCTTRPACGRRGRSSARPQRPST